MRPLPKNALSFAHLPTWMLIIGYPIFWLELFFHHNNHGVTTPLAMFLFGLFFGYASWKRNQEPFKFKNFLKTVSDLSPLERMFIWGGLGLGAIYLLVCAYAALLPPHLMQESDVLTYHYTFPRQHLIRNQFSFIPWSTCDLFPYPIQFGLAPFWFATVLPNKLPQFLFLLGMLAISARLLSFFTKPNFVKMSLIVFAILGSHHIGIQSGTAMLDIVVAYLFLASLDSFLRRDYMMAGVEFCFYFWSKSFIPFQTLAIIFVMGILVWGFHKAGYKFYLGFLDMTEEWKRGLYSYSLRFLLVFLVASIFVAAPFLSKSLGNAGTPIYPFFVGTFPANFQMQRHPDDWKKFLAATEYDLSMKDAYGIERSGEGFVKHLWLLAVPEQGVNNRFDYPLGLIYLLCLGPFIWYLARNFSRQQIALSALFILIFWASWWFGSQQSRFLFVPLLVMYILVLAEVRITPILMGLILSALFLTTFSVIRAHRPDWGKSREEVLRPHDREMLDMNREYINSGRHDRLFMQNSDIGYAQFPVRVTEEKLPFIIPILPR